LLLHALIRVAIPLQTPESRRADVFESMLGEASKPQTVAIR